MGQIIATIATTHTHTHTGLSEYVPEMGGPSPPPPPLDVTDNFMFRDFAGGDGKGRTICATTFLGFD